MRLISVYSVPKEAHALLYRLLQERNAIVNISHVKMPSWEEHKAFIQSCPYRAWYLIDCDGVKVGAVYLTQAFEIGVFILQEYQGRGYSTLAVVALMKKHGKQHYLANINPLNQRSIRLFETLGFRHVQNTYRCA